MTFFDIFAKPEPPDDTIAIEKAEGKQRAAEAESRMYRAFWKEEQHRRVEREQILWAEIDRLRDERDELADKKAARLKAQRDFETVIHGGVYG